MRIRREHLALAAFLTESILAGGNAVGVRFSNRVLDPLWGAGLRFGLAALFLGVVMALFRLALPRGRALLYGSLMFGATFGLAYYALVRIHAGLGRSAVRARG